MSIKKIINVLLLLWSSYGLSAYKKPTLNVRFALGPSWHNFFSYESFILTEEAKRDEETPQTAFIETPFQPMLYAEGLLRLRLGKYAHCTAFAGGGHFSKGQGGLNYLIAIIDATFPTPFLRPIQISGAIALFDIQGGTNFAFCNKRYSLNPLVGYTFNREKFKLTVPQSIVRYAMDNHWKGPYLGLEGSLAITHKLSLSGWYKFVFATVQSQFNRLTPSFDPQSFPIFRILPDALQSCRYARARGNLFNIQAQYQCSSRYTIGSACTYLHYKNHCPGSVRFAPQNIVGVQGAVLNQILWQQVMWAFFIEGTF